MVDESIVNSVRAYLRVLNDQGFGVNFGVIFGSQVTGKSDQWSDIDLLIISPVFDNQRSRQHLNLLWRLAARTDSRIEPIPCGEQQWKEDDSSAIIEIARREGIKIALLEKEN